MEQQNIVRIRNVKQALLYIKNGLEPLRVYYDNGLYVYVFDRAKSKPLFDKWVRYELN